MYSEFKELSEKIVMPLTYIPAMPAMEQVPAFVTEHGELGERFNEIAEMTPLEILEERYGFSDPIKAALYNSLPCGVIRTMTDWDFSSRSLYTACSTPHW